LDLTREHLVRLTTANRLHFENAHQEAGKIMAFGQFGIPAIFTSALVQ
jgi:hypothetical protein